MAQRRGGSGMRRRRIARLGGRVGRPQVVVCALGLALLLAFGAWRSAAAGGFAVERADGAAGQEAGQAALAATGEAEAAGTANGGAGGPNGTATAAGPGNAGGGEAASVAGQRVMVHVDGAVASPGVYELAGQDPRVGDAVSAAGGLAANADTSALNLAARIADGSKVHVPAAGEDATAGGQAAGTSSSQPSGSQPTAQGGSGSAAGASAGLVNINTATAEELDALPGVGPSTAQAIVEDRDRNGPFASPEDLMRVSGIGEKKFAKLQGSICV